MALESFSISQLSKKSQLVVFTLLALAVAGVIYTYYISPFREQVAKRQVEIEALEAEITQGRLIEAQLPEFQEEVRRQEARLRQVRRILPSEKETAEIMLRIQDLATQSRLRIKSFTPQKTVSRDFYDDWPILLSIEGNYNSLGEFFQEIGQFTRVINIEDVNIRSLDDSRQGRTIGATCTATTFVFREEQDSYANNDPKPGTKVAARF